jgi:hypothetical protein
MKTGRIETTTKILSSLLVKNRSAHTLRHEHDTDREKEKHKPFNRKRRRIARWEVWKHLEYWLSWLASLASLFFSKVGKIPNRDRFVDSVNSVTSNFLEEPLQGVNTF